MRHDGTFMYLLFNSCTFHKSRSGIWAAAVAYWSLGKLATPHRSTRPPTLRHAPPGTYKHRYQR